MLFPSTPRPLASPALAGLALAAILSLLSACGKDTPVTSSRFSAFGTQVDLTLVGINRERAREAAAWIRRDFEYLAMASHPWDPGPMGRVNQQLITGEPFVAPPSLLPIVRLSQQYEAASGGLFNPATGYLLDLWGFHAEPLRSRPPPRRQDIASLVEASPSMSQIEVAGLEMRGGNRALKLDFGALACGYAIDVAIGGLREIGVRNALIQAGGTARSIGDRKGQPWRIPVLRQSGTGVLAILPISGDESVASVAIYDRYYTHEGRTYHHIIDPRTGAPATGMTSATVLHRDAAGAAAAATALLVAGPEAWRGIARDMGVRAALLMDAQGRVQMDPVMAARIELIDRQAEILTVPSLGGAPVDPPVSERP